MQLFKTIAITSSLIMALSAVTSLAQAEDWVLDNESSSLSFVSTKLNNIAEVLSFDSLAGTIDSEGRATFSIDVTSLNTGFEIRDQRMNEFLFNGVEFPEIQATAQVDMKVFAGVDAGETTNLVVPVTLKLLGTEHALVTELLVTAAGEALLVSAAKPVILNATPLGLDQGVAKLGELAGGIPISDAVSVSFNLRFVRQ